MKIYLLLFLFGFLSVSPMYAQPVGLKQGVQRVVKQTHFLPWSKAVRVGGLSYVVPSKQVGTEVLKGVNHSLIGTQPHIRFEKTVTLLKPLGTKLSRALAQKIVNLPDVPLASFPGYYSNFPKEWKEFVTRTHSTGGRLEVLLEAAYGEKEQFSGHFVRTFNEVIEQANRPLVHGVSARVALNQAFLQAQEVRDGFFIIKVAGNERRPKEILLLRLEPMQYISFNQSRANAWSQVVQETRAQLEGEKLHNPDLLDWKNNPYVEDRRETQGIMLQTDGLKYPRKIGVSLDGNSWMWFHLDAQRAHTAKEAAQAINIWTAWNKGYYVLVREGQVLFAQSKGKTLFSTPREVENSILPN